MLLYGFVNNRSEKSDNIFHFLKILRCFKSYQKNQNESKEDCKCKSLCLDFIREERVCDLGQQKRYSAKDIWVVRGAIYQLKWLAALLLPGMVPKRKPGFSAPKKILHRTNKLLEYKVTNPSITAVELKNKHLEFLHNVLIKTSHY